MQKKLSISFIGGGNMAAALITGLAVKVTAGSNIHVVDVNTDALKKLALEFDVSTATGIDAAVGRTDVIVLALKPQLMESVMADLQPHLSGQIVISIAAGISAATLSRWLGGYEAVVRCMPNTPALIARGITGMFASSGVSAQQRETADQIMRAVGSTMWVEDEALIDAVTAISGSGPAYVFYFIEAMQQAAQELGLTAQQGIELATATFVGASHLAAQSSDPVSVLRERVTSKGGTTYAALSSLESSGVKQSIINAAKAAAARSKELGEELGQK